MKVTRMTVACGSIGGLAALFIAWDVRLLPFTFPGSLLGGMVGILFAQVLYIGSVALFRWIKR